MQLLLPFAAAIIFSIFVLSVGNRFESIQKIEANTARQTELLRERILTTIRSESEGIDERKEKKNTLTAKKVLYATSVNLLERNFEINGKTSSQCVFGPISKEIEDPVYMFKRELNKTEGELFEKYSAAPVHIVGIEPWDLIIKGGTIESNKYLRNTDTVVSYEVISLIVNVSFPCPENTFCCGLFCCHQPIEDFFVNQAENSILERENFTNGVVSIDNIRMSQKPIFETNSTGQQTVALQCEFQLGEKNDYYSRKSDIISDSVFYQCPEREECCQERLCCGKPHSSMCGMNALGGMAYGIVIYFVIFIVVFIVLTGCLIGCLICLCVKIRDSKCCRKNRSHVTKTKHDYTQVHSV